MMTRRYQTDEQPEDDATAVEAGEAWRDMYQWEETPFRSTDDTTLLSYGFHYSSSGNGMELVTMSGDLWYVDISKTVPQWFLNGKKLGAMTYDEVVNTFKVK